MTIKTTLVLLFSLFFYAGYSHADAPLKTKLDLDVEQARQVAEVEKSYRRDFRAKRGDFNRESRKLRRARSANDSKAIAEQEAATAQLREEMIDIRRTTDEAIRRLLNADQNQKFDAYIEQRQAMVGSSRDSRVSE